jgi:Flp pilus assembly pilin Flp
MLRLFVAAQQRLMSLRERAESEDGVTVPEYMLVLGFISVAVVIAFMVTNVTGAIGNLTNALSAYINPGS